MDAKENLKRTTLRLPQDLYDRLEHLANENNRSLNSEIISILDYSVGQMFLNVSPNEADENELKAQATRYQILVSQLRGILETDRKLNPSKAD